MMLHKYLLKKDSYNSDDKNFRSLTEDQKITVVAESDLSPKFPAVWDHGRLGSSQSHAVNAIFSYLLQYDFTPSHLFTYYNLRELVGTAELDVGGSLHDSLRAVSQFGIADSLDWPYDIGKFADKPPQKAYDHAIERIEAISQYNFYRLNDLYEIQQALSIGITPIVGAEMYENFETHKTLETGIFPVPAGKVAGDQALVIVGHCDNNEPRCKASNFIKSVFIKRSAGNFKIRNSWGVGIGLNGSGYFLISYETLGKILVDIWGVTSMKTEQR
jgi:C1A family cysteine protease